MTPAQGKTIKLSPEDNVMVALDELAPDFMIEKADINSRNRIPAGHKVAISRINSGRPIIKYGQTIGFASQVQRFWGSGSRGSDFWLLVADLCPSTSDLFLSLSNL